jgi:hypothetical protein
LTPFLFLKLLNDFFDYMHKIGWGQFSVSLKFKFISPYKIINYDKLLHIINWIILNIN